MNTTNDETPTGAATPAGESTDQEKQISIRIQEQKMSAEDTEKLVGDLQALLNSTDRRFQLQRSLRKVTEAQSNAFG